MAIEKSAHPHDSNIVEFSVFTARSKSHPDTSHRNPLSPGFKETSGRLCCEEDGDEEFELPPVEIYAAR
jgi:hypothetical protein